MGAKKYNMITTPAKVMGKFMGIGLKAAVGSVKKSLKKRKKTVARKGQEIYF